MYSDATCTVSNPFVPFAYSFLLFMHFICLILSFQILASKVCSSAQNRIQSESLVTSLFAFFGDIFGILICVCGLLLSLKATSGNSNLDYMLIGMSGMLSMLWGAANFFCCFNICLVWIKLAVLGVSLGKRGRYVLIAFGLSYIFFCALFFLIATQSFVQVIIGLGCIYELCLSILFVKAAQILSTKLKQVAAGVPEPVPIVQNQNSLSNIVEEKNQGSGFFLIKSKTSVLVEVQPKDAPVRIEQVQNKYAPSSKKSNWGWWTGKSGIASFSGADYSMAVQANATDTGSDKLAGGKNNEPVQSVPPPQIQLRDKIRRHLTRPAVDRQPTTFLQRNLQQIERVQKLSKWLSRFTFLFSISAGLLAISYTNPQFGPLPGLCVLGELVSSLLARATIVEYLRGSNSSVTGILSAA